MVWHRLRYALDDAFASAMKSGPHVNIKTVFPGMSIPIVKIRKSHNRLIFIMVMLIIIGIPILVRRCLYIHDDVIKGNIFRVTGSLCGEFTGHRWIPRTKASDAELWYFLWWRLNKRLSKQWWGWWFGTPSRPLWRHSNVEIIPRCFKVPRFPFAIECSCP